MDGSLHCWDLGKWEPGLDLIVRIGDGGDGEKGLVVFEF